jgi:competence protein ComEA
MFQVSRRVDAEVVAAAQRRLEGLRTQLSGGTSTGLDESDELGTEAAEAGRGAPSAGRHLDHSASPRWLPLPSRQWSATGRVAGITSQQVAVVAVILALCVAVGAWLLVRSRPQQLTSPPRVPLVAPTTTPTSGASPPAVGVPATGPASTPTVLVVDVAGKVRRPGIVELPSGSRVIDAIRAAGGARPRVDLANINLARPLVDGEQILVGAFAPPAGAVTGPTAPASTGPTTLVNINTATQQQLEELPGIGPVTAQAILTWRAENGSFTSVDELLEVSGIGDATLADLRPFVTV